MLLQFFDVFFLTISFNKDGFPSSMNKFSGFPFKCFSFEFLRLALRIVSFLWEFFPIDSFGWIDKDGFKDAIDVIDDWLDFRLSKEFPIFFLSIEFSWKLLFIAFFSDDRRLCVNSYFNIFVLDDLDFFILFSDYDYWVMLSCW